MQFWDTRSWLAERKRSKILKFYFDWILRHSVGVGWKDASVYVRKLFWWNSESKWLQLVEKEACEKFRKYLVCENYLISNQNGL